MSSVRSREHADRTLATLDESVTAGPLFFLYSYTVKFLFTLTLSALEVNAFWFFVVLHPMCTYYSLSFNPTFTKIGVACGCKPISTSNSNSDPPTCGPAFKRHHIWSLPSSSPLFASLKKPNVEIL